jgi:uncharacterized protein with HEPN domain
MLEERDKANIEEVFYAIEHIEKYLGNILSIEDLLENTMVYDAVMMNFILIGEACKRLSVKFKTEKRQIDWGGINGYRNFIAHEYFGVDGKIVWRTIKIELPKLKKDLQDILDAD